MIGRFINDYTEYKIEQKTPRPWINYLWNKGFLSIFTNSGQGEAFRSIGAEKRSTIIQNRMIYLKSGEHIWNANGIPVNTEKTEHTCTVGRGYSTVHVKCNEIETEWTAFVPVQEPCEIWRLTVKNTSRKKSKVRVLPSVGSCFDGQPKYQAYFTGCKTEYYPEKQAIICKQPAQSMQDLSPRFGAFIAGQVPDGFETRYKEFYGIYGMEGAPKALLQAQLGNNTPCMLEKMAMAFEYFLELEPAEEKTLYFSIGVWNTLSDIDRAGELCSVHFADELQKCIARFSQRDNLYRIDTGNTTFDGFVNVWLRHQTEFSRYFARGYFNGYRDMCQDCQNNAMLEIDAAKQLFYEILAHQYKNGFAPRGWRGSELITTNYADSPVWILYLVYQMIMETGDLSILEEVVPYVDGGEDTVYDHAAQAICYLLADRNAEGLCRIHGGDWNDVLNCMGLKKIGGSVWLTEALLGGMEKIREIAQLSGREFVYDSEELRYALDKFYQDGFYAIGSNDDGKMIGIGAENDGGIFLNAQTWAVISGAADAERANSVMNTVEAKLKTQYGYAVISTPYTAPRGDIGFVTTQSPGGYQNGSIYSHANSFKVKADAMLKRNVQAWQTLEQLIPCCAQGEERDAEPYEIPNAYFSPHAGYRGGKAGQSWITGTAGWIYNSIYSDILGIKPTYAGLIIDPCLPPDWRDVRVVRRFRGAVYNIHFVQTEDGINNTVKEIRVNGEVCNTALPTAVGGKFDVEVELVR